MFKDLIQITISYSVFNMHHLLIINNKDHTISLDKKCITLPSNEFFDFTDALLRIIREWENKEDSENPNTLLFIKMKIVENKKEYPLYVRYVPNNFNDFLELINKIPFQKEKTLILSS